MNPIPSEAYESIFHASPDGILVVDSAGTIRLMNEAAEGLFGYPPEELLGASVDLLVPEGLRGAHEEHRKRYQDQPRQRPMGVGAQLAGRRKDGTEFPVEISLSPVDTQGEACVIATVRDVTQRKRLKDLSSGALRASEEERRRIARELHDDTAQRLATLLVRLKLMERAEGDALKDQLEELRNGLQEAAESVRRVARGLRPPELEDAGVGIALRAHARTLEEAGGLSVQLDLETVDHHLDSDSKLVLYRIVQEALSNVLRHSGAGRAQVRVWREEGAVRALVEDQGAGFEQVGLGREGAGLGLIGMQERAVMIGGQVQVDSKPGEGTRVSVSLPVSSSSEAPRG